MSCFAHLDHLDAAWKLDRIMLRYRPIAPKPPAAGEAPAAVPEAGRRGKRRGGPREGRRGRKARRVTVTAAAVTLPLMPETPERKVETPRTPSPTSSGQRTSGFKVVAPRAVRVFGSWVSVERVAERGEEVGWCGGDEGAMEADDCPCFVSDGSGRVVWTNAAYGRMVVGEEAEGGEEVRVGLATRGLVPPAGACRAFTCLVTVRHAYRRRGRATLAAPCDVWCMADGALAWRLDVKAALSLSLAR